MMGGAFKPADTKPDSVNKSPRMTISEKNCGTNCIRKYDKTYRLYNSMEKQILNQYLEDADIDPKAFAEMANRNLEKDI